jgi:hypothetical protein
VQFNWQILNETGTSTIQLQISSDSINYQTIKTITAGGTVSGVRNYSTTVNNLNPGTYYFRLLLSGDNCRTSFSEVQVVKLKACSDELKVYPNPVNNILYVKVPQCEPGDLRVINAIGQTIIIMRQVNSSRDVEIPCKILSSGVYFLQFIGHQSKSVVKFEKF